MEVWTQEVDNLRQTGKEEGARHMSMIGEAVQAVQVEAEGGIEKVNETMRGVIQRLESISSSVEQGKASMEGKLSQVEIKISMIEKEIEAQKDKSKDARQSEYWKPIMENKGI